MVDMDIASIDIGISGLNSSSQIVPSVLKAIWQSLSSELEPVVSVSK
jgi:hypothetical protein